MLITLPSGPVNFANDFERNGAGTRPRPQIGGLPVFIPTTWQDRTMDVTRSQRDCHPVAVMAQLSVRRGRAAVEFYKTAFGAVEDYRVGGSEQNPAVVAQLSVGDATFWVADESPEHANFSPETVGGSTARLLLVVEDPDAAIATAVAAGAREVRPAADEHGWRLGRIEDPFGHHWEIGRPLIPWPPDCRPHGG